MIQNVCNGLNFNHVGANVYTSMFTLTGNWHIGYHFKIHAVTHRNSHLHIHIDGDDSVDIVDNVMIQRVAVLGYTKLLTQLVGIITLTELLGV